MSYINALVVDAPACDVLVMCRLLPWRVELLVERLAGSLISAGSSSELSDSSSRDAFVSSLEEVSESPAGGRVAA